MGFNIVEPAGGADFRHERVARRGKYLFGRGRDTTCWRNIVTGRHYTTSAKPPVDSIKQVAPATHVTRGDYQGLGGHGSLGEVQHSGILNPSRTRLHPVKPWLSTNLLTLFLHVLH